MLEKILENAMKNMFKKIMKTAMEARGINPKKLTNKHFENLWKISKETKDETEKNNKLEEYLKTYVL